MGGTDASNYFNSVFSIYSDAMPHIIPSLNYTMTSADNAITVTTTTTGQKVTLPDCTALTGRRYTILNLGASNSVELDPFSATQLINSAVLATVSSLQSKTLTAYVPSYASGGCQWRTTLPN
jgi:hypothetical protein